MVVRPAGKPWTLGEACYQIAPVFGCDPEELIELAASLVMQDGHPGLVTSEDLIDAVQNCLPRARMQPSTSMSARSSLPSRPRRRVSPPGA
jgi:hypothetical protein